MVEFALEDLDFEIIRLLYLGLTDAAISKRLSLSHRTVQRRVQSLMGRCDVNTRFALGVRLAAIATMPDASGPAADPKSGRPADPVGGPAAKDRG